MCCFIGEWVKVRIFVLDTDNLYKPIPPTGPLKKAFGRRVVVLPVTHDPVSGVAPGIDKIFLG
jgi:hypothetical protein